MKYFRIFLIAIILCAPVCAQNYSNEVTLVQQDDNSITVLATAVADKKKDAAVLATKSAFHTLFHTGIPDVKNGVPMFAAKKPDYDYRFFGESRYINYIGSEVQTVNDVKINNKYRVTVKVTMLWKTLRADLEHNKVTISPGWTDAKAVKATAALNPTIVVIPYVNGGGDFEAMRELVENDPAVKHAIAKLTEEFGRNGYQTRNFLSQLQNSKTSAVLSLGSQSDETTKIIQRLPGDIVVTVDAKINSNETSRESECSLKISAVEKQTDNDLATGAFESGRYMTNDAGKLVDYAIKKIKKNFFVDLKDSFEEMIMTGREVFIEMRLSKAVTDWDFEQDAPAGGEYFKDALDEWLRSTAHGSVYDMSNSTDKYIRIRLNIPLWNQEKNRSYTLSNFGSDFRKFLKTQLGDDYKPAIKALGQRLDVTIE